MDFHGNDFLSEIFIELGLNIGFFLVIRLLFEIFEGSI